MNINLRVLAALFVTGNAAAQDAATAWKKLYPEVEKMIVAPKFKNKDYNIKDFGAVADNPGKLNHGAINAAIDKCSADGGGRVVVPAGVWHTGPITLKSNVNLYVDERATLLFTTDLKEYPNVLTRWEGIDCYNHQPLIYAYGQKNIAVTGKGLLDAAGSQETWWGLHAIAKESSRVKLFEWINTGVPVEERRMLPTDVLRPQFVNLYKCENILIEGITLVRTPFWVIHPLLSNNITVRGVTIHTSGAPNGDGCDPESCKNVLIENCLFDTGDDCIAIKSGRNEDGRRWNVPSENIIVRNCKMVDGHAGVAVGSEISGGYKNLFVENCEMDSPQLDRVIRIKTSNCRGGVIENVFVRNIKVGVCKEAVLRINLNYDSPREQCDRTHYPIVRNVWLDNVTSNQSKYGVFIDGYEDRVNVLDVHLSNCAWTGVASGNRIDGKVENLTYKNVTVNGKEVK